jgi:hypothetical protein
VLRVNLYASVPRCDKLKDFFEFIAIRSFDDFRFMLMGLNEFDDSVSEPS